MSLKLLRDNLIKNDNFSSEYFSKSNIAFEVAEMVRSERMKNGLTQKELAKLLKTKQTSIARLESGNDLPSLSFLEKIAKVLKTQLLPPKFLSATESKTIIIMDQGKCFNDTIAGIFSSSSSTIMKDIN